MVAAVERQYREGKGFSGSKRNLVCDCCLFCNLEEIYVPNIDFSVAHLKKFSESMNDERQHQTKPDQRN